MNRKASQEKRYDAMNVLNNVFLLSKDISSKYDNADNVLQGSSIDKKYLDFLSSGEYYEKYKPGIFIIMIKFPQGHLNLIILKMFHMVINPVENMY